MQTPLAEHATGARITCLAAEEVSIGQHDTPAAAQGKGVGGKRAVAAQQGATKGAKDKAVKAGKEVAARGPKKGGQQGAVQEHVPVKAPPVKAPPVKAGVDRIALARQGVVKDGVVEFVDSATRLKPTKKRRKRSAEEAPSLEAADQAAMELGLDVDVHEQHAVMEEARGGKRGRGAGAGRGRGRGAGRGRGGRG